MRGKIGKTQIEVMQAMDRHGGNWSETAGWYWENYSTTRAVMSSLVKRMLVRYDHTSGTYYLTDYGKRIANRNAAKIS